MSTLMMEAQMWLFNHPAPRGTDIKGGFAGHQVEFPANTMKSFPFEVGNQLKTRYPFLAEVVDHPSVNGRLPPPPSGIKSEPTTESQVVSVPNSDIDEMMSPMMCLECRIPFSAKRGLTMHNKMVHDPAFKKIRAKAAQRNTHNNPGSRKKSNPVEPIDPMADVLSGS